MTRLQKQSAYAAAVLLAVALAVGTLYLHTRSLQVAQAGFALIALLAFVKGVGGGADEPRHDPTPARDRWAWRLAFVPAAAIWLYLEWHVRNGVPTGGFLLILLSLLVYRRLLLAPAPRLPRYDEREMAVLTKGLRVAGRTFWVAFVAWSVLASLLFAGRCLPAGLFASQVWLGAWVLGLTWAAAVYREERGWQS
ncbi:MAG: hypothetical protein ABIL09_11905 [Gemmatimonadota bacterium]